MKYSDQRSNKIFFQAKRKINNSLGTFLLSYLRMIRLRKKNVAPLRYNTSPTLLIFKGCFHTANYFLVENNLSSLELSTSQQMLAINYLHIEAWEIESRGHLIEMYPVSTKTICADSPDKWTWLSTLKGGSNARHMYSLSRERRNSAKVESCIGEKKEELFSFCRVHVTVELH